MFDDILAANARYASRFALSGLDATAARGLAVLTCIDSRIEPLGMLGLAPGDAKILRNGGGRVTDDALRSLVLASNLLGVTRVCIVQHTGCRLASTSNEELRTVIGGLRDADATGWDFLPIDDQERVLRADVAAVRACPLLPPDLEVGAFVYDVETGRLHAVA